MAVSGTVAAGVILWPHENRSGAIVNSAASAVPSEDSSGVISPDESEPAGGDAHGQAVTIDGLLDEMTASRAELGSAVAAASRCDRTDEAIGPLGQVKTERQEQVDTAQGLQVDAISSGIEIREALTRAARYSLEADEAFLAWAEVNQGCGGTRTPADANFERGQDVSIGKASPAKREFVELWNPVAEQEGLPTRSVDKF
jgi:hypothetical protein